MTMCRRSLEKRINQVRKDNRRMAHRVADKLLGIRKFVVLRREDKWDSRWKVVKTLGSRDIAEQYARSMKVRYWLVEEIFE